MLRSTGPKPPAVTASLPPMPQVTSSCSSRGPASRPDTGRPEPGVIMEGVIGRAWRERRFQPALPARLRAGCLFAAVIILATGATPALAAHPSAAHADAAADAVVARLRELPMPLRAFAHGVAPTKATPPSLPPLESRRQK